MALQFMQCHGLPEWLFEEEVGRSTLLTARESASSLEKSAATNSLGWSNLSLAGLIHVDMKRLTPDEDSGLGIEAEYHEALRLLGK
jgi:hypothetical protein